MTIKIHTTAKQISTSGTHILKTIYEALSDISEKKPSILSFIVTTRVLSLIGSDEDEDSVFFFIEEDHTYTWDFQPPTSKVTYLEVSGDSLLQTIDACKKLHELEGLDGLRELHKIFLEDSFKEVSLGDGKLNMFWDLETQPSYFNNHLFNIDPSLVNERLAASRFYNCPITEYTFSETDSSELDFDDVVTAEDLLYHGESLNGYVHDRYDYPQEGDFYIEFQKFQEGTPTIVQFKDGDEKLPRYLVKEVPQKSLKDKDDKKDHTIDVGGLSVKIDKFNDTILRLVFGESINGYVLDNYRIPSVGEMYVNCDGDIEELEEETLTNYYVLKPEIKK